MMNRISKTGRQEIPWIHLVRVLACVMVVAIHICNIAFEHNPKDNFVNEIDSIFAFVVLKPCVPLFLMVTGYLILPYSYGNDVKGFYRKRVPRVLFPLLSWSVIYAVLPYCLGTADVHQTLRELLLSPIKVPEPLGCILWYLFVLLGIYLIIPFVSERIYDNKKCLFMYLLKRRFPQLNEAIYRQIANRKQ